MERRRAGRDRRTEERLPSPVIRGKVTLVQPVAVRELSRTGAQIETEFALQVDSIHELRLALGSLSVVVKGRIVHCSISEVDQAGVRYRAGVEFLELSDRLRAALDVCIEALKERLQAREEP